MSLDADVNDLLAPLRELLSEAQQQALGLDDADPAKDPEAVRRLAKAAARKGWISAGRLGEFLATGPVTLTPSEADGPTDGPLLAPAVALATLGQGGQGEVLLAMDPSLGRAVALKRLLPGGTEGGEPPDPTAFLAEARITAQLDHPGVVPVYSLDTDEEGRLGYTMKLVRGRTLSELVEDARADRQTGRPPSDSLRLPARLDLFVRICDAVAYAHARGVIHRDLKPDNVMVGAFGELLVLDWGIARVVDAPEAIVRKVPGAPPPVAGDIIGTAGYMAPEQARGEIEFTDARSDQFALGLILHELIGLRRARTGETSMDQLMRAYRGDHDPLYPAVGSKRLRPELRAIVHKATELNPERRYSSVTELADDIRRFLHDEPVHALPDSTARGMQRWMSHNRSLALNIGLGLALLVVLVAIGGMLAVQAEQRSAQDREERLSALQAAASGQAHRIDDALRGYEAILTGLAAAAEEALQRPGEEPEVLLNLRPTGNEVKLVDSPIYDAATSVDWPDYVLAPGIAVEDRTARLEQLSTLRGALKKAAVRSWTDAPTTPDQVAQAVLHDGVPLVWTYLATEDGIAVGYPGTSEGYPEDYDPRERSWYRVAAESRTRVWSALDEDESGLGLLLTCSVALRGEDDALLGVAAVDLTFGRVIRTLLPPRQAVGEHEAFLVDTAGLTVVRSSQAAIARDVETYRQEPFPWPELLQRMPAREDAGHVVIRTDAQPRLMLWARMKAVDWTYVLVGDPEGMLAAVRGE